MSARVWDAAKRDINPNEVFVENLGEHYLKGLSSPENIIQILPKSVHQVDIYTSILSNFYPRIDFFLPLPLPLHQRIEFVQRHKLFPVLVTNKENPKAQQEDIKFQEYQQDEAIAESESSRLSDNTTEKLTAIVNEIDATLKGIYIYIYRYTYTYLLSSSHY